jgi:hypothetical protein
MFLSSVIIYFGENPVGYDLFKEDDVFEFKPALNTSGNLIPPAIIVHAVKDGWEIIGAQDPYIKEQVSNLIKINSLINLPDKLSAAP